MRKRLLYPFIYLLFTVCLALLACPSSSGAEDLETIRMQYQNDVEAVTKHFEAMIPPEARDADGKPIKEDLTYKTIKGQYDTAIANVQKKYEKHNLERIDQHNKIMKNLPPELAKKLESTGRDPAFIHSDYDFSADSDAANAYAKEMEKPGTGNKVIKWGDRYIIKGKQDTTMWIKKRPGSDPIGSSSFEAEVAHKAAVDSDAYLSVGEKTSKKVEILDHTRKFVHAKKNAGDIRVQGKTLLKVSKTAGMTPVDSTLGEQSNKLYNENATVEQAGIVDFGDPPKVKRQKIENWTKRAENAIVDIYKEIDVQSSQEQARLEEQIKKANESGDAAKASELKKTKIKNIIEVTRSLAAISESDPEFGGKLTGNEVTKVTNPDGSVVYKDSAGRIMSKSKFVNMTGKKVLSDLKSTYKSMLNPTEPIVSYLKTPTSIKAGAFSVLTLLFLYETWREKKKEQQSWEGEAEVAAKALWEVTGIPGAIGIGYNAAQKALKEYQECVNAGRKDCSKVMTVLKANLYAVNDANRAYWTGIADIPGFVINTPLRWDADRAEEIAKEMEKRVEEYRPVGTARRLAAELSRLADEADTQLRSFKPLDEQAWNLQRQVVSVKSSQQQLNGSIEKLKKLCGTAKELSKQVASIKNPAEITANLTKRLAAVKQYVLQTCTTADQAIKAFNEGRIDEKALESNKNNVKSAYLDQAEAQYAYAQQEMALLKGPVKESTDFLSQAQDAQKEFTEYMNFIQAVSKNASRLVDDYVKKITQLNVTVNAFNDTRTRFLTGVKYFYNERTGKEQEELLEIARRADKLKIDTKSAMEHERQIKEFHKFAVEVNKLAQMKPEPCKELDQLLSTTPGKDPLVTGLEEAGQKLAEGRKCYANLKGTTPVTATVSIRVSPGSGAVTVGDTLTFSASVFPEVRGTQYYFRWIVNNQESGNRGNSQAVTIARTGSHTVKVEAFRAAGSQGQKIGEAVYSLTAKASIKGGIKDYKKPWWEDYKFYSGTLTITTTLQDVRKVTIRDNKGRYISSEEFKESVTCKSIGPVSIRLDRKSISGGFRITTGTYPAKYEITEGYKTESGYKCAPIEATNEKDYLHSIFGWTLAEYSQGGMGVFRGNEGIAIKDGRFIYIGKEEYDKGERGMGGKGLSLIGEVTGDGQFKLWIKRPYGISGQKDVYYYIGEGRYDETRMSVSYSEGSGGQLSSFLLDKKSSFLLDLNRVVITKP